jgi:hypothetical protein
VFGVHARHVLDREERELEGRAEQHVGIAIAARGLVRIADRHRFDVADLAQRAVGGGVGEVSEVDALEARRVVEARRHGLAAGTCAYSVALAVVALDHQRTTLVDQVEVADRGRAFLQRVAQSAAGPVLLLCV